ncbi:putative multidrug resistance protein MdtD [Candidatus Methanoplasma termitum]|uniref:MdtD1 protein n=2 Tax=Candidatus Methanoplasma termitum TaxID=1577791 RepID=A0A0A7LB63_9ARCH|nr:putative multidrug resistance protein MdtD [Candidatus Methanoplasma termitum]MCL2333655.1 MFS transporter [Candidatus Methanoplasma sp.]
MAPSAKFITPEMRTLLIACCAGVFIMPLMSTMMNLALVDMGRFFDVGAESLALVNTIFLLGSVVSMVPLAKISDIVGRKKIFIIGLIITTICSIIAGLSAYAGNFTILLAMRFGMGAGSAAVSLTSVAMLTEVFPFERRGWAIGIQTAFIYFGSAVGPAFGGVICQFLGWNTIFFFILPFALLALFFISKFNMNFKLHEGKKLDQKGSVLFSATVMITMFGAIFLPDPKGFILIAVGMVMLYFFFRHIKGAEFPVLNFGIFKYKVFSRSVIATFMNYASSYSVSFFLAIYLQSIGMLNPMNAGMIIVIQPAIQVVLTIKFGSQSDRIKDKRILPTLGMAITAAGVLMIMFLGEPNINLPFICVILAVLGVGYGVFSAPNTSAVMSSVPPKLRGEASGMVALLRQLGMMVSMTIAMCTISIIMGSSSSNAFIYGLTSAEQFSAFIAVIQVAFGICFVMCVIGTLASWFRGKNPEGISEFE